MNESEFVNSLHIQQRKAYGLLKDAATAELRSRIENLEYENDQLKSILAGTESRYSKPHTVTEATMRDILVKPHLKQ